MPSPGVEDGPQLIGLEEAAARAGLHYMTVYRRVRTGRLPAVQQEGRWWVDPAELARSQPRGRPGRGAGPARWLAARQRLVDRLMAADPGGAWAIIEEALTRGANPADVYLQLLGPALSEIGHLWSTGKATVRDEHQATAVALRLAGRLSPRFVGRGTPGTSSVIIGGAPGDPHLLPVLMVADLLRSRHLRVLDLGANVPEVSFLEAAASQPDLAAVGISLSDSGCAKAVSSVFRSLRRDHREVLLVAGGPALSSREEALGVGADEWARDGLDFADLIDARRPRVSARS
jgi:methanogenic corrinoid protein MtbC1